MQSKIKRPGKPATSSLGTDTTKASGASKAPAAADRATSEERLSTADLYRLLGLQLGASEAAAHHTHEAAPEPMSPQPDPWWHSIGAAMSWIMVLLIEGFAAYGVSLSPGCFSPGEDHVDDRRADETPLRGAARGTEIAPSDQASVSGRDVMR